MTLSITPSVSRHLTSNGENSIINLIRTVGVIIILILYPLSQKTIQCFLLFWAQSTPAVVARPPVKVITMAG